MYKVWSALIVHSRRLLDLAAVRATCDVRERYAAGAGTAPTREICGSEGRSGDLADFRPRSRGRWMRIAIAQQTGGTMPPVELIQVGDAYFVRDGHHHISVARALGQREIDARITVWEIARPRPRGRCMGAGALETELMYRMVSSSRRYYVRKRVLRKAE
jgi:hypothetical protein